MKEYLKLKRSFTLIELLVVIAIIALLSSIILVSLSGPRDRAKIAKVLEFSQSVQHAIGNEAVGVWNFDEGSGTLAKDASGYANNGTLYNFVSPNGWSTSTPYAIVGSGQGKYALSFDGVDDYVDCGNGASLNFTKDFSIELWLKTMSAGSPYSGVIGKYGGTSGYDLIISPGGFLRMDVRGTSAIDTGNTGNSLFDNKWHHIVVVVTISSIKIFDNTILRSTTNGTWTALTTSNPLTIGARGSSLPTFNGIIDDVRIYDIALSLSEIQQHYLAGLEKHQKLTIK